jgi:hypothetical protein
MSMAAFLGNTKATVPAPRRHADAIPLAQENFFAKERQPVQQRFAGISLRAAHACVSSGRMVAGLVFCASGRYGSNLEYLQAKHTLGLGPGVDTGSPQDKCDQTEKSSET